MRARLSLLAILLLALTWGSKGGAATTGTTGLFMPHGAGAVTGQGDYISASAGGLDSPYRYFIEVPPGLGRLQVDIFDADVGIGGAAEAAAGRDRGLGGGGFTGTAAVYTLTDPGGTVQATLRGDVAGPALSDNLWLAFFDSRVPQFRSSSTNTVNTAASINLALPAGTVQNDLLIAVIARNGGANAVNPPNATWLQIDNTACAGGGGGTCRLAAFWHLAGAAEVGPYNFSWTGAQAAVGTILRYSGVDTTTPIDTGTGAPAAQNGNSATPTAPSITTTVANTRIVRAMVSNNGALAAPPDPRDHTGRFALQVAGTIGGAAADDIQFAAAATGTAAFALTGGQQWRALSLAIRPAAAPPAAAAGHWELAMDMSGAVNGAGAGDINAFGLAAHDGTAGPGGTELNVYYDSHTAFGVNDGLPPRTYTTYPYVVSGCTAFEGDFDYDRANVVAPITQQVAYSSPGRFTSPPSGFNQTFANAVLSANDGWLGHVITRWTSDSNSFEYGIWTQQTSIQGWPGSANYANVWTGNYLVAGPAPGANPTTNAFRTYLATDAGAAPVKPYFEQYARYQAGPATPTAGQTTVLRVTLRFVNPTPYAITFGAPATNVVTVTVPGPVPIVVYQGGATATQGSVTTPAVGAAGTITWNPGAVGPTTTATLFYDVAFTPTAATGRAPLTGTPAANGTQAVFVDETGNATMTLGPLCELAATRAVITPAVVSSVRARQAPGGVEVEWETASEVGTAGFDVLRWDPAVGGYAKLNGRLLPALQGAPQGGRYRFLDETAPPVGRAWYIVSELTSSGQAQFHGAFDVAIEAERAKATGSTGPFQASPRSGGSPLLRTLAERRRNLAFGGGGVVPFPGPRRGRPTALQIGLERTGLYFVSTPSIAAGLGLPQAQVGAYIAARRFALSNQGRPVAWTRVPGGLLFYGRALESIYATDNVYWLRTGPGLTMRLAGGGRPSPTGPGSFEDEVHSEENHLPATLVSTDPDSDYWYWEYLSGGDPSYDHRSFPVTVTGSDPAGGPGRLRARLQGATSTGTSGEHHAAVSLNGSPVGEVQWEGIAPATLDVAVSPALVRDGTNTVEVTALLDAGVPYSIFYVDGFDLDYSRKYQASGDVLAFRGGPHAVVTVSGFSQPAIGLFDVSAPATPRRIVATTVDGSAGAFRVSFVPSGPDAAYVAATPAGWLAPKWLRGYFPAGLKTTRQGADYLVLTTSDLRAPAERLASLRQGKGLRARVVEVADVMAEFSNGISDPRAIRTFLKWASQRWSPAPRFLLLAGQGSLDYKDYLGFGGNLLPPLMVSTPSGLFASDTHMADLDDDGVPDLAVGRVTVLNAAELDAYVDKVQAYEASDGNAWKYQALWLADKPSTGPDFPDQAESLVPEISPLYTPDRIYLADGTIAASRAQLLNGLNAGAGLVNFVGHGGIDRLSSDGLLVSSDVSSLTNAERLPFMTALTCTINRFEVPGYSPLGGELVKRAGGGASAVWAPTGLSLDSDAHALGQIFYARLAAEPNAPIGDLVRRALAAYASTGRQPSLLSVYNLIGDPLLSLKAAPPLGGAGPGEGLESTPASPSRLRE